MTRATADDVEHFTGRRAVTQVSLFSGNKPHTNRHLLTQPLLCSPKIFHREKQNLLKVGNEVNKQEKWAMTNGWQSRGEGKADNEVQGSRQPKLGGRP
jgi:hypothetical protein